MQTTHPETVGLSHHRLKRIDARMKRLIDEQTTAGIITLIARRGEVAHFATFGRRDIAAGQPMTPDTIFRIYSMTKPITSLAVLMLYEQGHFQLTDPVAAFIPAFNKVRVFGGYEVAGFRLDPPQRPITIRDLLTHTAGLSYGLFDDSPIDAMYRTNRVLEADIDLATMIERLVKLPLIHQPGTVWRYSVATDVLSRLVEVISGQSFDRFLAAHIFEPLEMSDTAFRVPEAKKERLATLYGQGEDGGLRPIPPFGLSHYGPTQKLFSGGGGLVSTAADYLRFTQLMLNNGTLNGLRLVSRKSIELMTTNHLLPALLPFKVGDNFLPGCGFGLGVRVLMDLGQSQLLGSVGEYGWTGAASTYFWIDPQEDFIGIFLTQLMPSNNHPLARMFKTLAYQAIVD